MNKDNEKEIIERLQSIITDKDSSNGEKSIKPKGKAIFKLNKDMLILAVLIILVVISGIQTVKLSSLQAAGNGSAAATAASNSSGSSGGGALPSSLENLPSQVGGC